MKKLLFVISLIALFPMQLVAGDAAVEATAAKVKAQLNDPTRSAEHKARDAYRKPVETLEYFGLRDDMTVVEIMAGHGWYTKILAPVLKDKGKLYVAVGTQRLEPKLDELGIRDLIETTGKVEGFAKTEQPGYIFDIESVDLGVENVDMVLTFRNMHNLSAKGRKALNDAVFKALKPGGIYGVIDHTKRHNEAFSEQTWRRIDPVRIIEDMVDAGFRFVDYSDMHANPEDGLIYDTTHESLKTNSDRFTLKFSKPK